MIRDAVPSCHNRQIYPKASGKGDSKLPPHPPHSSNKGTQIAFQSRLLTYSHAALSGGYRNPVPDLRRGGEGRGFERASRNIATAIDSAVSGRSRRPRDRAFKATAQSANVHRAGKKKKKIPRTTKGGGCGTTTRLRPRRGVKKLRPLVVIMRIAFYSARRLYSRVVDAVSCCRILRTPTL